MNMNQGEKDLGILGRRKGMTGWVDDHVGVQGGCR